MKQVLSIHKWFIFVIQGLNPGAAVAELKKIMMGQESKGIPRQDKDQ